MYRNYFSFTYKIGLNEIEHDWIVKNTTKPKWKWDKRFPKRQGRLLGVYLDDADALVFKMKFRL